VEWAVVSGPEGISSSLPNVRRAGPGQNATSGIARRSMVPTGISKAAPVSLWDSQRNAQMVRIAIQEIAERRK
jgi:hypothetical protein